MEKKSIIKTSLILFIGIALGVLMGGRFTMHKIHRANHMRTENGFIEQSLRVLDLSPTMQDSVMPVLRKFAVENHRRHKEVRSQQKLAIEVLRADLSAYLSPEELKKMHRLLSPKGQKDGRRKKHHKK